MSFLRRIKLKGFKSIKEMDLELRSLNVLVGVNGAGKSNLIAFFKMLNEMMGGRLQYFIAQSGRAQALLHFGADTTKQIDSKLEFETDNAVDNYSMVLTFAVDGTLFFSEETLSFHRFANSDSKKPRLFDLGVGHQETQIKTKVDAGDQTARTFHYLLSNCRVFHFHDTTPESKIRQHCYLNNDRWLMPHAENLPAILYRLREKKENSAYRRILETIRQIAPFLPTSSLNLLALATKRSFLTGDTKTPIRFLVPINSLTELFARLPWSHSFCNPERCFLT